MAEDLIERLRSPIGHSQPVDPKAIYRTRPVALFEEAADALARKDVEIAALRGVLAKIGAYVPGEHDSGERPYERGYLDGMNRAGQIASDWAQAALSSPPPADGADGGREP